MANDTWTETPETEKSFAMWKWKDYKVTFINVAPTPYFMTSRWSNGYCTHFPKAKSLVVAKALAEKDFDPSKVTKWKPAKRVERTFKTSNQARLRE